MMRPTSIRLFELLYLLAIAIEVTRIVLDGQLLTTSSSTGGWTRVAAVAISILLVVLAARRRKGVAALVLSALFLIGLPVAATMFQQASIGVDRISIGTQIALQLVATAMLLAPASRDWLAGRDG